MAFQSYTLFPWLTVKPNVCFGLREKGTATAEQEAIAARYMEPVDLTGFASHCPRMLPVWEGDRKTVLFVTHDIEAAISMTNRVLVMTARRAAPGPASRCRCRIRATAG